MAFEHVLDDVNFNYQVNRILSFGDAGCDREEVLRAMEEVTDVESWYQNWRLIAEKARKESRYLHSMYYYRMAEFMLLDSRAEKEEMYQAMKQMFAKAFPHIKKDHIPYKNGYLPSIHLLSERATQTIVIHGGFDSFMEELYMLAEELLHHNVNIILFEGEGQGETLRQGMPFHEKWEQSVGAVLDYYELENVTLMGISWGGYFALRAAAYEKRIKKVICHGVLYDAFDVQSRLIKQPARAVFKILYQLNCKKVINALTYRKMQASQLTEWGITHGMYITQTKSPFAYLQAIEKHTLRTLTRKIDQQVLLLTGEADHYIPRWQYHFLKRNLPHAKVDSRMFTKEEGGEQHCQVGNYEIAIEHIVQWMKRG